MDQESSHENNRFLAINPKGDREAMVDIPQKLVCYLCGDSGRAPRHNYIYGVSSDSAPSGNR